MDMINNLARKVAPVIMLVLLVSLLLTSCGSTSTKTGEITPEEYDDIRNGMTYEEVCQIIGGEPIKIELASSTDSILLETVENQKYGIDKAIRLSPKNVGDEGGICSLPLYMAFLL